jgi:hypothetical protein
MDLLQTILDVLSLLALIVGWAIFIGLFVSAIVIAVVILLLAYSFKTGNFLFPNLIVLGISFFESPIKSVLKLFHIDDTRVDKIGIDLKNRAMFPMFKKVPFNKRAIFIPQCLRSVDCPARLSPEGIKCKECGACGIAKAKKSAESLGYLFFIVPGSSFMIRMLKKYKPYAIIGVGCMSEVKEGLEMAGKYKLPVAGVVLNTTGCVETTLNWDKFFEVMQSYTYTDGMGSKTDAKAPEVAADGGAKPLK